MSDHKGARLMFHTLPNARTLIADKGYDSDDFREALKARGTEPRRNRKAPLEIRRSTASATKSRTSSPNSRTGGASPPATPLRARLLLGHLHRRSPRLLPQSMSPEPAGKAG
jgi:IS5 family transposase